MPSFFIVITFVSHAEPCSIVTTSINILICLTEFLFIGLVIPCGFLFIQSKTFVINAEYFHVISIIQLFCTIDMLFCHIEMPIELFHLQSILVFIEFMHFLMFIKF